MDASSNTSYLEPMPIAVVVAIIVCVVTYLITRSASGGTQPKTKEELQKWIKEYCEGVKNHGEPNTWNVTLVTDMSYLFSRMKKFNAPIDQWNTSEVTNMDRMFAAASSFNQPITMDTSKVTDMEDMFKYADAMTHPKPSK